VIVYISFHCRRARKLQPMGEVQNKLRRHLIKLFEKITKNSVLSFVCRLPYIKIMEMNTVKTVVLWISHRVKVKVKVKEKLSLGRSR
jgi:hypothetical protein